MVTSAKIMDIDFNTTSTYQDFPLLTGIEEIIITNDDGSRYIYKLNQSVMNIGRGNDNDIILNSSSVSRYHAKLEWQQGVWYLTDLGSSNGIRYGSELIESLKPHAWQINDTVRIGQFRVQLRQHQEEVQDKTMILHPHRLETITSGFKPLFPNPAKSDVSITMWPLQLQDGGQLNVAIQNEGNQRQIYDVRWESEFPIFFAAEMWRVEVMAGAEKRKRIKLIAKKRAWLGPTHREYPFRVTLSNGNIERELQGTLLVNPYWTWKQLYYFLGGLGVISFLFLIYYFLSF